MLLLLLHVPPADVLESSVVPPLAHAAAVPLMASGSGTTAISCVRLQPVLINV
jgi:hypothetical protein